VYESRLVVPSIAHWIVSMESRHHADAGRGRAEPPEMRLVKEKLARQDERKSEERVDSRNVGPDSALTVRVTEPIKTGQAEPIQGSVNPSDRAR